MNDAEYKNWLYYLKSKELYQNLLELIDLYGRDKVLDAINKMEKKYDISK